jgi:hypothetical protein
VKDNMSISGISSYSATLLMLLATDSLRKTVDICNGEKGEPIKGEEASSGSS